MSSTGIDPDDIDPEEIPSPSDVTFAPLGKYVRCAHVYSGIEKRCKAEATHIMHFEGPDDEFDLPKCDEHGIPFIVRERHRRQLDRPVLCQVCRAFGASPYQAGDVTHTAELMGQDGEEHLYYICEDCVEENDLDAEPVDDL